MQWLLEAIVPNTYPILEKQSYCLEKLFKLYVLFFKDADLIGCETIAIDGTKAEPTIARKPILIKENRQTCRLY
jgi:hypothetical protein